MPRAVQAWLFSSSSRSGADGVAVNLKQRRKGIALKGFSAADREAAAAALTSALRARFGLEPGQYHVIDSSYRVASHGVVVEAATIFVRGRPLRLRREDANYTIRRLDGLVKVTARTRRALELLTK